MMPGICGGFTTFSTFSLETLNLARNGDWPKAAANIAGSLLLCLAAVWAGYAAGAAWNEK
jgi:CrcB protein